MGAPGGPVVACMTARAGGVSLPPWHACNLGDHVGDDPTHVAANRALAAQRVTGLAGLAGLAGPTAAWPVGWLQQVHGHALHRLTAADFPVLGASGCVAQADGVWTTEPGLVCAVMVADCLPVLLAAPEGRGVAALHAGWRGLAGASEAMAGRGILDTGVRALCEATGADPADLQAWLGPCIGPAQFQVGKDVLQAFDAYGQAGAGATLFRPDGADADGTPRWLADLAGLGRARLMRLGVRQVFGGAWCTASDPERFFSFRRERATGRQAAMIAIR